MVERTIRDPFSNSEVVILQSTESHLQKVQSQGRKLQCAASVRDGKTEGKIVTAKIQQGKWEIQQLYYVRTVELGRAFVSKTRFSCNLK